jgi:lambda family phage tail tape measure protein
MADLEYSVGVNTKNATQGLKNLQRQVGSTSEVFGKLKGAIAGIAIGGFIKQTFEMANSMRDLSSATGIALQGIVGFSQALAANGGTIDKARDGIGDFVKNLGEAANGSKELQSALRETGVSLEQLGTLSEGDLLRKVINGLGEMDDKSRATAVSQRLFGESVKGVDLSGVARDLDRYTTSAGASAAAIDKAGKASQQFKNAFADLQIIVLEALEPLSKLAVAMTENRDAVKRWLEVLVSLASAFAIFKGVKLITAGLMSMTGALAAATSGSVALFGGLSRFASVAGAKAGLKSIKTELRELPNLFRGVAKETASTGGKIKGLLNTFAVLGRGFLRFIPVIGQLYLGFELLAAAVKGIFDIDIKQWIADTTRSVAEFFGFIDKKTNEVGRGGAGPGSPGPNTGPATANRAVVDALAGEKARVDELVKAYENKAAASLAQLKIQRQQLDLTSQEIEYQDRIRAFTQQYTADLAALDIKLRELNQKPRENAELIAKVRAAQALVTTEYQMQLPLIQEAAAGIRAAKLASEEKLEIDRKITEQQQRTNSLIESSNRITQSMKERTSDLAFELKALNMDPLERQIAEIKRDVSAMANAEIKTLKAALLEITDPASKMRIEKQIESIQNSVSSAIKSQVDLTTRSYDQQRSFTYGWKKAFESYKNNATDAAQRAQEIFAKSTRGLEDLIVNFAKTGKFEWKSFVADMLETLLRSNIQQVFASIFDPGKSGSGGIGGLLGGLGDIFGMGGGNAATRGQSANNPMFVREVDGSAGMFSGGGGAGAGGGSLLGGIGNAISGLFGGGSSGGGSSGGGFFSGITDTLGKVASGIGKFFGGFFADGGHLPAGKFGIVGERGPEIINGPANITPMSGMGGNVTLNINAVDAMSFRALVARDPGFIAAVAQKGMQAVPSRR